MMYGMAALHWISSHAGALGKQKTKSPVILWGQSIGAGVASNVAAKVSEMPSNLILKSLILETPFISIRDMLITVYPQRWLPYRYLWPFLWNHLDSLKALEQLSMQTAPHPKIMIVQAGKDEMVPKEHADILVQNCGRLGIPVEKHIIASALHTEVTALPLGRSAVATAIRTVVEQDDAE